MTTAMACARRISDSSDRAVTAPNAPQSLQKTAPHLRKLITSDRSDSNSPHPTTYARACARNGVHAQEAVLRSLLSLTTPKTITGGWS